MFIVGLTGGIGSGKSTIAQHFEKLGIQCIDADQIARDVVNPGMPALDKITQHFGNEILNADGTLNRIELRKIIFDNETERLWINQLLHPLIRTAMIERCQNTQSIYCILMIPLLFENKLESLVNRVLVIDVDVETQIRRTTNRDKVSTKQVQSIIQRQCSRAERNAKADDIIDNSDHVTEQELHQNILKLHAHYKQLAYKAARI